jgi:hypothetical protein
VRVGFGAPPLDALGLVFWTDISAYVWFKQAPISIARGRSTELDTVSAGRLTLTLKNTDRRFDPDSYYSPYYPNVKPRARIQVQARWPKGSGSWRDIYVGYVTEWKPVYLAGRQAACQVTALDALSLFGRRQVSLTVSLPPGESPAAATNNVLNVLGWPAGDRATVSTSSTRLPQTDYTNVIVLNAIQQFAKADDGLLFVGRQGYVTYHDRNYRASNRTPVATFGNGAGTAAKWRLGTSRLGRDTTLRAAGWTPATISAELPYKDIDLVANDAKIRNDVRMTRVGGVEQAATDAPSQALYDVMSYAESGLLLQTDAEVDDRAEAFLARYKDPQLRANALTFNSELGDQSNIDSDAHMLQLMTGDLDQLVRIIVRPPGGGWNELRCWIERVNHTINANEWQVVYGLSADDPTPYLVLDDDELGLLDTNFLGY